jgi:hypothetical protein
MPNGSQLVVANSGVGLISTSDLSRCRDRFQVRLNPQRGELKEAADVPRNSPGTERSPLACFEYLVVAEWVGP